MLNQASSLAFMSSTVLTLYLNTPCLLESTNLFCNSTFPIRTWSNFVSHTRSYRTLGHSKMLSQALFLPEKANPSYKILWSHLGSIRKPCFENGSAEHASSSRNYRSYENRLPYGASKHSYLSGSNALPSLRRDFFTWFKSSFLCHSL